MDIELKPCKCGTTIRPRRYQHGGTELYFVACRACKAEGPHEANDDDASRAWNGDPTYAALRAELAELRRERTALDEFSDTQRGYETNTNVQVRVDMDRLYFLETTIEAQAAELAEFRAQWEGVPWEAIGFVNKADSWLNDLYRYELDEARLTIERWHNANRPE